MNTGAYTVPEPDLALEAKVVGKTFRHLLPFLFVLCVFSYLDRINVAFAAVPMNKTLGLTATMFGFGSTIFYAGYALCAIPSNMMLNKLGARKWIAIILIGWGFASTSTMFAAGPTSFYAFRLLVGVLEAGFFPGVLLYLTFWFPSEYRARATGTFLIAQPVTIMLGASISGVILDHAHGWFGLNLDSWRWLFLLEGMPVVFLGLATYFYLSDGPAEANWLSNEDKVALLQSLKRSDRGADRGADRGPLPANSASNSASTGAWAGVFSRNVTILSLIYFCVVVGLNSDVLWTPQIIREVLKSHSLSYVGVFTAIPALCALILMPIWSARSDRHMERAWHFALPMLVAALGWVLVAVLNIPLLRIAGFILCCAGIFTAQIIFWAFAPNSLPTTSRPVGIAWINSWGIVAASLSPLLFGFLRDLTKSWYTSLLFVGLTLAIAAVLIFLIPADRKPAVTTASEKGPLATGLNAYPSPGQETSK